jgi:hypothetical protein
MTLLHLCCSGCRAPRRKVTTMMPVSVPKVLVRPPGERQYEWMDLWESYVSRPAPAAAAAAPAAAPDAVAMLLPLMLPLPLPLVRPLPLLRCGPCCHEQHRA